MQDLLKPDLGVLALTILNFALLVFLLAKFAWKPIIGALEKREEQVRTDKETAEKARIEAVQLKQELDEKLSHISQEAARKMAEAVQMGEAQKEEILTAAKGQAESFLSQAREQIVAEKTKAIADIQSQIAQLSILAASRVIEQQLNEKEAARVVEQVLQEVKNK
ncbi:MAG: F0F1 ATP synthase subunit B [Elusimicrobiaceae bacterium]|nr:F0F1 ATP synthase subunit B [Elusimicrobiaceae bacterium]